MPSTIVFIDWLIGSSKEVDQQLALTIMRNITKVQSIMNKADRVQFADGSDQLLHPKDSCTFLKLTKF